MEAQLSEWEGEGGSLNERTTMLLSGTANQIEWAKRIMAQVDAEFDRVANALQTAVLGG